jgi:hypothetical protein
VALTLGSTFEPVVVGPCVAGRVRNKSLYDATKVVVERRGGVGRVDQARKRWPLCQALRELVVREL